MHHCRTAQCWVRGSERRGLPQHTAAALYDLFVRPHASLAALAAQRAACGFFLPPCCMEVLVISRRRVVQTACSWRVCAQPSQQCLSFFLVMCEARVGAAPVGAAGVYHQHWRAQRVPASQPWLPHATVRGRPAGRLCALGPGCEAGKGWQGLGSGTQVPRWPPCDSCPASPWCVRVCVYVCGCGCARFRDGRCLHPVVGPSSSCTQQAQRRTGRGQPLWRLPAHGGPAPGPGATAGLLAGCCACPALLAGAAAARCAYFCRAAAASSSRLPGTTHQVWFVHQHSCTYVCGSS
jgi:hypothetical protein